MFSVMRLLKKNNFKTIILKNQKNAIRLFSSDSHHHDSHNKQHNDPNKGHTDHPNDHHKADNHNDHGEHHDEHHGDHHHHEVTGEVDLKRIYVPLNEQNHRYLALLGLPSDSHDHNIEIEGEWKAHNAVTPIAIPVFTYSRRRFKRLANVSDEENPYFHPEPYGYLFGDDPFDPNPSLHQRSIPLMLIFFGLFITFRALKQTNGKDQFYTVDKIFHAHHMAGLLEDEMRKIRKIDYPFRKKYDDVKNEKLNGSMNNTDNSAENKDDSE